MKNCISFITAANANDYIYRYDDKKYIKSLPTICLPAIDPIETRAFEHVGCEMHFHNTGLFNGDILICRALKKNSLNDILHDQLYVIVTKQNVMCRRISGIDKNIILTTENPNYPSLELNPEIILEYWKVIGVFSMHLNKPSAIEERLYRLEENMFGKL